MVSTPADAVDRLPPAQLVAAATATEDSDVRRAAQKRIATMSSLRVARTVLGASLADKVGLIRELGATGVPAQVLPVVLAALGSAKGDELRDVLGRIRNHRAAELGVVVTGEVGEFIRTIATTAAPRDVLGMLDWAAGDDFDDGIHIRPFVAAAVAALERVPASGLDELRFATGMTQLFALGGAEAAALFDRWLAAPATGELVMRRMFDAHEQRNRRGGDDRSLFTWLAALWARSEDRDALARSLGVAVSQAGSLPGRPALVDWAWARFVDYPDERGAIYRAFASWRDDLIARRNALPRKDRPGGASAVAHLRVWGPIDLDRLSEVIEEAARLATVDAWPALVDAVFAIAADATRAGSRMAGLVGACRLGHHVTNRVREADAPAALDPAIDRLVANGQAVIDELRADGLEIDPLIASRIDDLETSMRLSVEARDKRIENERRTDERAAAAAKRDAEQAEAARRRDEEIARAQAAGAQAQADAARRQAELAAALAGGPAAAALGATALPRLELEPVDREPVFSGPLPTLLDYARFMVRMRLGGDAMALMRDHGLDPIGFSAVAQAWSQLIARRPDLAARFGALLTATWDA